MKYIIKTPVEGFCGISASRQITFWILFFACNFSGSYLYGSFIFSIIPFYPVFGKMAYTKTQKGGITVAWYNNQFFEKCIEIEIVSNGDGLYYFV